MDPHNNPPIRNIDGKVVERIFLWSSLYRCGAMCKPLALPSAFNFESVSSWSRGRLMINSNYLANILQLDSRYFRVQRTRVSVYYYIPEPCNKFKSRKRQILRRMGKFAPFELSRRVNDFNVSSTNPKNYFERIR